MAIIYTYTLVTPQPLDSVVITDASDNNYTKTSYIGDAVAASIAPGANIYFTFGGGITTINAADYDLGGTWINDLEYNIELTEDNNGVITVTKVDVELEAGASASSSTGNPLIVSTPGPNRMLLASRAYAGGSNVGHVPAGGAGGEYLDGGTGLWTTLPADQNTTYDLNSLQNVNDSDIRLVGSDGTTDIVKLVAGTNITLTDTGSNITIDAASGGYSWIIEDTVGPTSYTVGNTEQVIFTGTGGITVTASDTGGGVPPYTITIDGSSIVPGTGTVTEVDATVNAGISPSGITLVTTPALGITTTGSVDLGWSGSIGDLLYGADDGAGNAVLTPLAIGGAGTVLTSDGGNIPSWTLPTTGCTKSIGAINTDIDDNITIDACLDTVDFTSPNGSIEITGDDSINKIAFEVGCASDSVTAGVKVSATLSAESSMPTPAGEGTWYPVQKNEDCEAMVRVPESAPIEPVYATFVPMLVTQGADGTSALAGVPGINSYLGRSAKYHVVNGQVYIDFYMEFTLTGGPTQIIDTLGVAVESFPGGAPIGLETLAGLTNLDTENENNAFVGITDCFGRDGVGDPIQPWNIMPSGGKLNHFNGAGGNTASVAWFYWRDNTQQSRAVWTTTSFVNPWVIATEETNSYYISGSLNPIIIPT